MKRLLTALMASCLLITAGCGANSAPASSEPAASASSAAGAASAVSGVADEPSDASDSTSEASDAADEGTTIEIDDSQAPTAEWETQIFTSGPFTFELPAAWKEYADMGSYTAMFFTDASVDIATQPSNVVVEIMPNETPQGVDYADPAVQDSFFEYMEQDYLAQRDPSNVAYSIWNGAAATTYVVACDRVSSGRTARQTAYFLMGLRFPVIVYATDFGDGMAPPVDEIARRIAATFRIDESFTLPQN